MTEVSDMELLRDYARQGSEEAFAALVRRHVDLVYSAALRQTGIAAHAEEITQAVFVILARKAARLRPDTVLEAWLYETTRLTSSSFLRGERRRQSREQEAYMQSTTPESTEASIWNQLAPLLDDAMARLGQKDREAMVLRYFKNKNLREVATAMQVSEAAAQRRVHRALEKLRKFFTKGGVISTTAIIAGAISAHSVQAAPVALAKTATTTAMAKGATAGGSILILVKGALKIMTWTKAKTAIAVGVGLLLAAGTTPIIVKKVKQVQHNMMVAEWKANRPEEIRRERARIRSRQSVDETSGATTIDLKPYLNATLTDSPCSPGGNNNNLAEMTPGMNIYGGVPFDVQGSIQLTGRNVSKGFPEEVDGIRINRRCAKLHLLHGSNWVPSSEFGTAVAHLVLHYEDGSKRTLDMIAGTHVFDWWFPLYKSGLNPRFFQMDPGTERAWEGSNPYLLRDWNTMKNWDVKQRSLILYKSTFTNPQPNVAIASMDYVRAKTMSGPFILGITVE